jgi:hypothetical protein
VISYLIDIRYDISPSGGSAVCVTAISERERLPPMLVPPLGSTITVLHAEIVYDLIIIISYMISDRKSTSSAECSHSIDGRHPCPFEILELM